MLVLKCYFHTIALIKKVFYKLIYGRHIKFGKNVTFRKGFSLVIEDDAFVEIGDGCFFNNFCSINAKQGIVIGNNCLFGENVKIYDHNHIFKYSNRLIKEQGFKKDKIQIGNNCWIASNVIILKNTNIGNDCVIAANQVVKKDIVNNCILENGKVEAIRYIEYEC